MQLLVFALGGERFALAATCVQRIVHAVSIAALPRAPAIVEGVVNVAASVIPVLDIRSRFRLPPAPLALDQHFIVGYAGPRLVALRVDRAEEVLTVPDEAVEAASCSTPGVDYVAGIARLADGLLVIHDLERFLDLGEARQLDAALGELAG